MGTSTEQETVEHINWLRSRFSAARDEMRYIRNSEPLSSPYREFAVEMASQLSAILEKLDANLDDRKRMASNVPVVDISYFTPMPDELPVVENSALMSSPEEWNPIDFNE